jgi:DNA-binding CsgD family transcriptional regulator
MTRAVEMLEFQHAALSLVRGDPVNYGHDQELGGNADREAAQIQAESLLRDGRAIEAYDVTLTAAIELLAPSAALEWPIVGQLLVLAARATADLAEAARESGDSEATAAAQVSAAEAERLRERFVELGDDPLRPRDTIARIRGDLAGWEAELARAHGHDTLEQWRRVGSTWEELEYRHRAAYGWWRAARRALREPVDRPAAADALRRAHALATGHVPLLSAIGQLAGRLRLTGLDTHEKLPGRDRHDTLTEQEQRVIRLVAQGRTNAQIAEELFISPKTASVHVSNILRKLNVPNRAAAAGWAHSVGLVEG